jgi:hypothetical protein
VAGSGGGGAPDGSVGKGHVRDIDAAECGEVGWQIRVGGGVAVGGDAEMEVDGLGAAGGGGLGGLGWGDAGGGEEVVAEGNVDAYDGDGFQVGDGEVERGSVGVSPGGGYGSSVDGGLHGDLTVGVRGYGDDGGVGFVLGGAAGGESQASKDDCEGESAGPIHADLRCRRVLGEIVLLRGDGEVEGYGLGDLDAGGGAGGDLILVGAGWGAAEVGVASVATAVEQEWGGCGEEEDGPEDGVGAGLLGLVGLAGSPEEEQGGGEEAEEGAV